LSQYVERVDESIFSQFIFKQSNSPTVEVKTHAGFQG